MKQKILRRFERLCPEKTRSKSCLKLKFHLLHSIDHEVSRNMSDEYAKVARGKLKLKTDGEMSKKKKKKKDKEKERDKVANIDRSTVEIVPQESTGRKLTKAEISFKKMQDKMVSSSYDTIC